MLFTIPHYLSVDGKHGASAATPARRTCRGQIERVEVTVGRTSVVWSRPIQSSQDAWQDAGKPTRQRNTTRGRRSSTRQPGNQPGNTRHSGHGQARTVASPRPGEDSLALKFDRPKIHGQSPSLRKAKLLTLSPAMRRRSTRTNGRTTRWRGP